MARKAAIASSSKATRTSSASVGFSRGAARRKAARRNTTLGFVRQRPLQRPQDLECFIEAALIDQRASNRCGRFQPTGTRQLPRQQASWAILHDGWRKIRQAVRTPEHESRALFFMCAALECVRKNRKTRKVTCVATLLKTRELMSQVSV